MMVEIALLVVILAVVVAGSCYETRLLKKQSKATLNEAVRAKNSALFAMHASEEVPAKFEPVSVEKFCGACGETRTVSEESPLVTAMRVAIRDEAVRVAADYVGRGLTGLQHGAEASTDQQRFREDAEVATKRDDGDVERRKYRKGKGAKK